MILAMRPRSLLVALLVASCTKAAVDDPMAVDGGPLADAAPQPGPSIDAAHDAVIEAGADAGAAEAGRCSDVPAYVCDFSIGSCHPLDGVGGGGGGIPSFPDDGGPDGSRAFRATVQGLGGATYGTAFRITMDGGAGCNFVCDVDLRLATPDAPNGTSVLYALPDFATTPARLEIGDGGWVHTGDDEAGAHSLPVTADWFHARMAMTRDANDAGATTMLTLSTLDGSAPSSTTQHVKEMPIGLRVGLVTAADA
jgi:hypothetical protein